MSPAGQSCWAVPCQTAKPTYTTRADCSTCISDQTDSTLFPPLGAAVQSSSPHGSVSSHGTAISISPKRTGRNQGLRYHSASQNKLASSIQGNLSFNSFKYKQSPEKVWAKQRQAQAVASGTVATRLHIGASLLGKCIGVCPFPGAQAEALETLLQQQNPANWEAGLAKHRQIAMEQRVQQLARVCCPGLQQPLHHLLQVTAFEVLPEAQLQHEAVVQACFDVCKKRLADQAATVKLHAQVEADLVAAAATAVPKAAATAVAAAAATTVAAAATAAEESGATEALAGDGHVDCAEMLAQAACGALEGMSPESVLAAAKVAEVVEGIQAASHTTVPTPDATAEDSQPEAAATAMASAETAMTDADVQGSADITAMSLSDLSTANAPKAVEPEELVDHHHANRSLSDGSADLLTDAQSSEEEEAGNAPERLQLFTKADMQLVSRYVQECSNSAYGRQAEHAMIQHFDREAQQAQHAQQGNHTWHKMGAPDHQELGVHGGISFELGCQIDRALYNPQSGKPIPVEFKNRVNRFPARLREHERIQVQAQLQLCNVPMGVLVERLQLPDGSSQDQWHDIVRDDRQWHDEVMPALCKFMAVVARLATEQDELEMYLSKRVSNQHHSYLKDLLRQQADCASGSSCQSVCISH